jgi:flagellin
MRYLHEQLKTAGHGGVKAMLSWMSANSATLDAAFTQFLGINHATFRANFQAAAVNFVNTKMNLTNTDTGAVGGLDADNGSVRTAVNVFSDSGSRPVDNPLSGFTETFEKIASGQSGSRQFAFHVGADRNQTIGVTVGAVNIHALGLGELDVAAMPQRALLQIDDALAYISGQRAEIGAQLSRMEMSIANLQNTSENITASRARIVDADYAAETATLVRARILREAGAAMLAQANVAPQLALSLLRA